MTIKQKSMWEWDALEVAWNKTGSAGNSTPAILLIHGFGACKEHWRHNQPELGKITSCYAIDLIGFGESSKPKARLNNNQKVQGDFSYGFDSWANQVADFCNEVVKRPVILIGNSIGGVVALRASQLLKNSCSSLILIDCAQRAMDDKRLYEKPLGARLMRPLLKSFVSQRWLSQELFKNAAKPSLIKSVLKKAYPSENNINQNLLDILYRPSQTKGACEAFHGFINIFNDHLAQELLLTTKVPVDLIWGEIDPWEPLEEAKRWFYSFDCIRSLEIIQGVGHCPHDEAPEKVNPVLMKLIQEAM